MKYLDQVEDMVRASYGSNKNETRIKEIKDDHSKDYSLDNEFLDNPRRKSRADGEVPHEIQLLVDADASNKKKTIEEFNVEDKEKHREDFQKLLSIFAKPEPKRENSTETLKKIEFIIRMKTIFSRNLFYSSSNGRQIELQESGMSMVGNNNDEAFITLNINNMTEELNQRCLTTNLEINKALFLSTARYSMLLSKERSDILQKEKVQQRKAQLDGGKFFPAGLYLKKMRKGNRILKGLALKEVRGGPRIAVINAVGGIGSGKSGNGANGKSLGSDTLISQVRILI